MSASCFFGSVGSSRSSRLSVSHLARDFSSRSAMRLGSLELMEPRSTPLGETQ